MHLCVFITRKLLDIEFYVNRLSLISMLFIPLHFTRTYSFIKPNAQVYRLTATCFDMDMPPSGSICIICKLCSLLSGNFVIFVTSHQAYQRLSLGHVLLEGGIFVAKHVGVLSVPSCVYNIVI